MLELTFIGIWILIPVVFFLVTFFNFLEGRRLQNDMMASRELFWQSVFLSFCSAITIGLDIYLLPYVLSALDGILPPFELKVFLKVFLFPLVTLTGARLLGGSAPIRIKKAPKLLHQGRYKPLK